jgi:hypothetical protein
MIARIIENVRKFYISTNRTDIVNWWIGQGPAITGLNLWLRVLYYIFSWFSIALFFYLTEKHVFQGKTKFIFAFSSIFEGIVSLALYFTNGNVRIFFQILATIGFFFCGISPSIIYLIMAVKSTGIIKQSATLATIGLILFVIAVMAELPESMYVAYLVTGAILDAWLIALVSPIAMLCGLTFLVIGYKKMFSGLY